MNSVVQGVNIPSSFVLAISIHESIRSSMFIPKDLYGLYSLFNYHLYGSILMVSMFIRLILYDLYGLYLMAYLVYSQCFMVCF